MLFLPQEGPVRNLHSTDRAHFTNSVPCKSMRPSTRHAEIFLIVATCALFENLSNMNIFKTLYLMPTQPPVTCFPFLGSYSKTAHISISILCRSPYNGTPRNGETTLGLRHSYALVILNDF